MQESSENDKETVFLNIMLQGVLYFNNIFSKDKCKTTASF
jgi:hypothetical protein